LGGSGLGFCSAEQRFYFHTLNIELDKVKVSQFKAVDRYGTACNSTIRAKLNTAKIAHLVRIEVNTGQLADITGIAPSTVELGKEALPALSH
jgi:hypothetical protein